MGVPIPLLIALNLPDPVGRLNRGLPASNGMALVHTYECLVTWENGPETGPHRPQRP